WTAAGLRRVRAECACGLSRLYCSTKTRRGSRGGQLGPFMRAQGVQLADLAVLDLVAIARGLARARRVREPLYRCERCRQPEVCKHGMLSQTAHLGLSKYREKSASGRTYSVDAYQTFPLKWKIVDPFY